MQFLQSISAILDDDDLIHQTMFTLVSLLDEYDDCGVAYSGAIRVWEVDGEKSLKICRI